MPKNARADNAKETFVGEHGVISPKKARILNDPRRLENQVSQQDLERLLKLRGDEDLLDLGSGTGFYTDRMAALTTGTVYAVDLRPEMLEHHRERGVPSNVHLLQGDITALSLEPGSIDVACSIATWHEVGDRFDVRGLLEALRPQGRLVVIDWRKDPESFDDGPPGDVRWAKEEVTLVLSPHFSVEAAEDLGRFMFSVQAGRE